MVSFLSSTSDMSSSMSVTSFASIDEFVVSELTLGHRKGSRVTMEDDLRRFQSSMLHPTHRSMLVCAGNTLLHPGIRQCRFIMFVSQVVRRSE